MRNLPNPLLDAQNSRHRFPRQRLIARAMRLKFSRLSQLDNPWDLASTDQIGGQNYVFGDAVALSDGTIIRAWAGEGPTPLYIQTITDPSVPANWWHTANPWTDMGAMISHQAEGVNCLGLVEEAPTPSASQSPSASSSPSPSKSASPSASKSPSASASRSTSSSASLSPSASASISPSASSSRSPSQSLSPSASVSPSASKSPSSSKSASASPSAAPTTSPSARLFYQAGPHDDDDLIGLHYRDLSDGWQAHYMGISVRAAVGLAPTSITNLYALAAGYQDRDDQLSLLQIYYDGAHWQISEAPFRILSDKDNAITATEYQAITYFDAFRLELNGIQTDFIVYCFGAAGLSYIVRMQNGVWGEPQLLLPDDSTHFYVYRASVMPNGLVMLSGRVKRTQDDNWSPGWDCYLSSFDGENWSALARDSFLCQPEIRGKLLLSGNTLYYASIADLYGAPATYQVGVDNVDLKRDFTDQVNSARLTYPAAGLSPSLDLELADAARLWLEIDSPILEDGSELWLEGGYETADGAQYVDMLHASIDTIQTTLEDGRRGLGISARHAMFKRLHDWTSPFYWTLPSQLRYFNPCDDMNMLEPVLGDWASESENLFDNGSLEVDDAGWQPWEAGATSFNGNYDDLYPSPANGTRGRSNDHGSDGDWSYKLVKTGGPDASPYGVFIEFQAEGGFTYEISVEMFVTSITGGRLEWKLAAGGNTGTDGAFVYQESVGTDSNSTFEPASLTIKALETAVVSIAMTLSDCSQGTLYLDNFRLIQTSLGYLRLTSPQRLTRAVLASKTPFSAGNFDLQTQLSFEETYTAKSVAMGLMTHYADEKNYLALLVTYPANTVSLVVVRGGISSVLASAAFTLTPGVEIDLRLQHRGGQFWAWAKNIADYDWLQPILTARWTTGVICNTDDGRGSVGVAANIVPLRFTGQALDESATTVLASVAGDLISASWRDGDYVTIDEEQISFTSHDANGLYGCVRGANLTTASVHLAGAEVRLHTDAEVRVDGWQYSDTEPNWTTESLLQRVGAMAGAFYPRFLGHYPLPGSSSPTTFEIPSQYALSYFPLTAVDRRNVDVTFDWTSVEWGVADHTITIGVGVRMSTTDISSAVGYSVLLHWADLGSIGYWATLYYHHDGISEPLDQFELLQHPVGTGLHSLRVLARDDWFALYSDGVLMGTFHDVTLTEAHVPNYVGVMGVGPATVTNTRIGELSEWRETAWVDQDTVGENTIESVIIDDRPIYVTTRGFDELLYSTFDLRQCLTGPEENDTFADLFFADQAASQDSDLTSMLRIYAVGILESLNEKIAREHGFMFGARQMQRAENLAAGNYFPHFWRRTLQTNLAHTQETVAHLGFEVEDQFAIDAQPSDGGAALQRVLIVNSLRFNFSPADFTMVIETRDNGPLSTWPGGGGWGGDGLDAGTGTGGPGGVDSSDPGEPPDIIFALSIGTAESFGTAVLSTDVISPSASASRSGSKSASKSASASASPSSGALSSPSRSLSPSPSGPGEPGDLLWEMETEDADRPMAMVVADGVLYIAGIQGLTSTSWGMHLEARSLADGSLLWKKRRESSDLYGEISPIDMAAGGGGLFLVGRRNSGNYQTLMKFDPADGARIYATAGTVDPMWGGPGKPWVTYNPHTVGWIYYTHRNLYRGGVSVAYGNGAVWDSGQVGGADWAVSPIDDPWKGWMFRLDPTTLNNDVVSRQGGLGKVRWDPINQKAAVGNQRMDASLESAWIGPTSLGEVFCFSQAGRLYRYDGEQVAELDNDTWHVLWVAEPTNPPFGSTYSFTETFNSLNQIAATDSTVVTVGRYLGISILDANAGGSELTAIQRSASADDIYTAICEYQGNVFAAGLKAGKWIVHKLLGASLGSGSMSPSSSKSLSASKSASRSASPSTVPGSAVTFDASMDENGTVGNANAASGTLTWEHIVGEDNPALFVTVECSSAGSNDSKYALTVKYNGVTMALVEKVHGNNTNLAGFIAVYCLTGMTPGAHNVTVQWTNSGPVGSDVIHGNSVSFENVNQSVPYANVATSYGETAAPWVEVVTATDHHILAVCGAQYPITTSDQTDRATENLTGAGWLDCLMASTMVGVGTQRTTWTISTSGATACIGLDVQPV